MLYQRREIDFSFIPRSVKSDRRSDASSEVVDRRGSIDTCSVCARCADMVQTSLGIFQSFDADRHVSSTPNDLINPVIGRSRRNSTWFLSVGGN